VAGNTVGAFTQTVAVAFGLGPLVERSVLLFTVLKLAGAGYLIFLGVQAIRHRHSLADALTATVERKSAARIVRPQKRGNLDSKTTSTSYFLASGHPLPLR
jgi:threonine/homoserine/homoserine lactone efflux protein